MRTCDHPREAYADLGVGTRNHCSECRDRVCLVCSQVAPESWMSGRCHGCYRTTEKARREQEARRAEESRLRGLAEAWEQGAAAIAGLKPSYQVANPYTERLRDMA